MEGVEESMHGGWGKEIESMARRDCRMVRKDEEDGEKRLGEWGGEMGG